MSKQDTHTTLDSRVLHLLVVSGEAFVSGEDLAEMLSVSRAAVWKAVESLRGEGYVIEAVRSRGYRLSLDQDILDEQVIADHLFDSRPFYRISTFETLGSTNDMVRTLACEGAAEGTVVVAGQQTKGRGRRGKTFHSPKGSGVYLSILLRPEIPATQAGFITAAAAVACTRAIDGITGSDTTGIKWVNDIFIGPLKVCGILTEASVNMESGLPDYVVVGIGLNVYPPDAGLPVELQGIAGNIFDTPHRNGRNLLTAAVLQHFHTLYRELPEPTFVDEYIDKSIIAGCEIEVIRRSEHIRAYAEAVNDDLTLTVRYEDGTRERLNGGEVSIRRRDAW